MVFSIIFSGCFIRVSYFDILTYKDLIDLKVEMKITFEEFSIRGVDTEIDLEKLKNFKLRILQLKEYEKNKQENTETIEQINILESLINEVIEKFKKERKLSPGYCENKWSIIESAFNKIIETEKSKVMR